MESEKFIRDGLRLNQMERQFKRLSLRGELVEEEREQREERSNFEGGGSLVLEANNSAEMGLEVTSFF